MQSKKEEAHELHKSKQRTNERTKEWKKECSGSKLVKKNRWKYAKTNEKWNKRTWNFQGRQQKDERARKRAKEQRARCEKRKEHEWSYWARRKNNNTHAEWNEMEESKSIRMELEKRNVCKMQSCRRHNDGNVIGAEKFGNNKQSSTRYFTFLSLARTQHAFYLLLRNSNKTAKTWDYAKNAPAPFVNASRALCIYR